MKLKNKIAIITGASTGIGKAIAVEFSKEGAAIGLVARSVDGLNKTLNIIKKERGEGDIFPTDLRNVKAIQNLAKKIKEKLPYIKIINAIHVTDKSAIRKAKEIEKFSDAILLDSRVGNQLGGTGKTNDWNISRQIVQNSKVPVILAGGLNPGNLKEAIEKVMPWGVDVHTGVENPDWSKNYEKIEKFIRIAKGY